MTKLVKAIVYRYEILFIDLSQQLNGANIQINRKQATFLSALSGKTLWI